MDELLAKDALGPDPSIFEDFLKDFADWAMDSFTEDFPYKLQEILGINENETIEVGRDGNEPIIENKLKNVVSRIRSIYFSYNPDIANYYSKNLKKINTIKGHATKLKKELISLDRLKGIGNLQYSDVKLSTLISQHGGSRRFTNPYEEHHLPPIISETILRIHQLVIHMDWLETTLDNTKENLPKEDNKYYWEDTFFIKLCNLCFSITNKIPELGSSAEEPRGLNKPYHAFLTLCYDQLEVKYSPTTFSGKLQKINAGKAKTKYKIQPIWLENNQ